MLSAKENYEIAMLKHDYKVKRQLKKVEKSINREVKRGRFNTWIYGGLYNETKEKLESLGYKTSFNFDFVGTLISWD